MKNFVFAIAALTLTAGGALAAVNGTNERPNSGSVATAVVETVQVPANTVMTSAELSRANLSGDELLTVTKISGDSEIADLNSDR
ncbi:hypothetical protein [Paracoccus sp. Ld10]|uniref:hypothetical protein n=1 Tax=Paracoccus sp. Ld10 TaxID=649158 RepID=UPI003864CF1A